MILKGEMTIASRRKMAIMNRKRDKQSLSSFRSSSSFASNTDTHKTRPRRQSNRSCRCTISWRSIAQEHCETNNHFLHFDHLHLSHQIQTLTTLSLYNNQIGAAGAQSLGEALHKNTVRQTITFFISIIFIFRIKYRHSQNSGSPTIKSELQVHNLLAKHCTRTL